MESQKKLIEAYRNRLRLVDLYLEEHNCKQLSAQEKGRVSQILYLVNSLVNKRSKPRKGEVKRMAMNLVTMLSASILTNDLDNIKEVLVASLKEVENY